MNKLISAIYFFCLLITPYKAYSLTPKEVKAVIAEFESLYAPFAKENNLTLKITERPGAPIVNTSGSRVENRWEVTIYNGILSSQALTADGFRFIMCHEFGHILGGAPAWQSRIPKIHPTSNAGQPDYYAASVCMKLIMPLSENQTLYENNKEIEAIHNKCRDRFTNIIEQETCLRINMAAKNVVDFLFNTFPSNSPTPSFLRSDQTIARQMKQAHPNLQCRLDTMVAGSLCRYKPMKLLINQSEQVNKICHDKESQRPRCWFVPQ